MSTTAAGPPARFTDLPTRGQRLARHPALVASWRAAQAAAPSGTLPFLLYGAYALGLFLIFVAATFPHELALRRALEPAATAPVAVEVRGVHLGWTLTYTIDELRLVRRGGDPTLPILSAAHVHAAPSLRGLLRGRPFPLGLRADLYGGTLDGIVDLQPEAFAVRANLANVDVGRYTGLRLFTEGTPHGRVDATIELAGNAARATTTSGRFDVRAVDLALEGADAFGMTGAGVHVPELHVSGAIKGGRLEVAEMSARGREVGVSGTGNVLLAYPLAASLLNLDVTLTPTSDFPEKLRPLLTLIPGEPATDGARHAHLSGTLAQPRLK